MGSFNVTCSLSGEIINSSDEVVVIPMFSQKHFSSLGIHTWSYWSPTPIMIEGKYNSYGGIENARIFDSMNSLNEQEKSNTNNILLEYFKTNFEPDRIENKNILGNYIGTRVFMIRKNLRVSMIETLMQVINDSNIPQEFQSSVIEMFKQIGFEDMDKAKAYYQEHKDDTEKVQVGFVYMKKNKLLKLLNNYGMDYTNNYNPDISAQSIQKERQGEKSGTETVKFVSGGDYAGANKPAFTWNSILKDLNPKDKSGLNNLYQQQGLDLALINDYMAFLGKSWMPTLTINEDAKYYGHDKAMQMQALLIEEDSPKNKLKK